VDQIQNGAISFVLVALFIFLAVVTLRASAAWTKARLMSWFGGGSSRRRQEPEFELEPEEYAEDVYEEEEEEQQQLAPPPVNRGYVRRRK
jgi:hypothetical protein